MLSRRAFVHGRDLQRRVLRECPEQLLIGDRRAIQRRSREQPLERVGNVGGQLVDRRLVANVGGAEKALRRVVQRQVHGQGAELVERIGRLDDDAGTELLLNAGGVAARIGLCERRIRIGQALSEVLIEATRRTHRLKHAGGKRVRQCRGRRQEPVQRRHERGRLAEAGLLHAGRSVGVVEDAEPAAKHRVAAELRWRVGDAEPRRERVARRAVDCTVRRAREDGTADGIECARRQVRQRVGRVRGTRRRGDAVRGRLIEADERAIVRARPCRSRARSAARD